MELWHIFSKCKIHGYDFLLKHNSLYANHIHIKVKMLQILLGDKTVDIVANVYRVKRVTQPKTL